MAAEPMSQPSGQPVAGDWSRDEWVAFADRLLDGARAWASPGHARITPPGAEGGYGHAVDGLEGFARTFLLAGFRIAGAEGRGVDETIEFYSRGIVAGVDPSAADRWVRLDEHPQAKVEAASIALILDMTRPWIWDRLDATTQQRVIDYLAPVVGDDTYPQTNWVWFRIVVQTFLRSVGGPWSEQDIADDLARHDSFARADGWLSDGDERSFDHYVGWALHVYPVLWSRMQGAEQLAGDRTAADVAALDRYLQDALSLVGADGSPLIQGRSLIYRFAAAAPFWVGALAGVPSHSLGRLRHAANSVVAHFADHGAPDESGLLSMGWHGEWRRLAQSYSGPASPYWAVKGLLGIALPASHPVWSAPSEPLPVETGDDLRVVRSAGWLVSGTNADGIVRIVNHGTDHAAEGTLVGDSPLYARLGYSTATSPLLDGIAWSEPLEQSTALLDAGGRATHRAALELIEARVQDDEDGVVAIGASTSAVHWMTEDADQRHHGSGITGSVRIAGRLTVRSLVRGPWEVRLVRLDSLEGPTEKRTLRIGGWPISAAEPATATTPEAASASADGLSSRIVSITAGASPAVVIRADASPLGPVSAVPTLEYAVAAGDEIAVLVELTGVPGEHPSRVQLERAATTPDALRVAWPDGVVTTSRIPEPRPAPTDR